MHFFLLCVCLSFSFVLLFCFVFFFFFFLFVSFYCCCSFGGWLFTFFVFVFFSFVCCFVHSFFSFVHFFFLYVRSDGFFLSFLQNEVAKCTCKRLLDDPALSRLAAFICFIPTCKKFDTADLSPYGCRVLVRYAVSISSQSLQHLGPLAEPGHGDTSLVHCCRRDRRALQMNWPGMRTPATNLQVLMHILAPRGSLPLVWRCNHELVLHDLSPCAQRHLTCSSESAWPVTLCIAWPVLLLRCDVTL